MRGPQQLHTPHKRKVSSGQYYCSIKSVHELEYQYVNVLVSTSMTADLNVNVVMTALTRVYVNTTRLREGQESAETEQVDCRDKGKH